MNGRLISFAAVLTTVVVFQPLAGCGENLPPENAAGSSATRAGAAGAVATAGVAGANVAGAVTSGGGGSGGAATAGTGVGGQISAGSGGASAGSGTGGSTAGSGTAGGGDEIPATFATVAALIKDRSAPHNCFGGACHDGEHPFFHLLGDDHELLSDDALYTFMLGYNTRDCGKLINTASPAESALVKVLRGPTQCGPLTRVMPLDKCYEDNEQLQGDCVPPEYVDAIQRWIAAGALR